MTKHSRTSSGKYSVAGKIHDMLIGTRAQVWHGTAHKTTGGLTKNDLMKNKSGRIVSKAKHNTAKREKRLVKAGFLTKKGQFGFIKDGKHSRRHSRRHGKKRGGADPCFNLTGQESIDCYKGRGEGGGKSRKGSRKMRGGMHTLSPSDYNGEGVGTSGVNLQFVAGNAA